MARTTRTGKVESHQDGAEPRTVSAPASRSRRTLPNPSSAKSKTSPARRVPASHPSPEVPAPEAHAPAESPVTPVAAKSTTQEVHPAKKNGTRKRKTTGPAVSARPSLVNARSEHKPARVANLHFDEASMTDGNGHFNHNEIARLAYSYWEARGYQGGSPEDDWYRAQAELRRRRQHPKKAQPRRRTRKT